jgi:hypothetical protein
MLNLNIVAAFPSVLQADGVTSYTWTAPPGVTLLSELLIVAGEMATG